MNVSHRVQYSYSLKHLCETEDVSKKKSSPTKKLKINKNKQKSVLPFSKCTHCFLHLGSGQGCVSNIIFG